MQEETRDRLLESAASTFAEKGYDDATVREICQKAGVNIAAVNYYFGDKERLYIETVKQAHRRQIDQFPLPQWPAEISPQEKLRGFIHTTISRMVVDPNPQWHLQLMMREMLRPTAACHEFVQDFVRPHFELLLGILNELVPAETPPRKRHLIAFSIIGQCLHYRLARPVVALLVGADEDAAYSADVLANHIADFSLAALAANMPRQISEALP